MASVAETYLTHNGVPLLLEILPHLRRIARLLEIELHKTEKDLRNFYRHFDTYCLLLFNNLGRVHRITSAKDLERYASRILERLESLLGSSNVPLSIASSSYLKIRTLGICWASPRPEGERLSDIRDFIRFGTTDQRDELLELIRDCVDELTVQFPNEYTPQEDFQLAKHRRKEPSYEVWSLARSVFHALNGCRSCNCSNPHDYVVRLALATYRSSKDLKERLDFDLLFCMDPLSFKWQEAQVQAVIPNCSGPSSSVKFVVSEPQSRAKKRLPRRQRVPKLCEPIRKAQTTRSHRLNLEVEDGQLWKAQSTTNLRFTAEQLEQTVSLGELISTGAVGLGEKEKAKRVLAVVLSYAVLHLHDGPWLGPTWGRDNTVFLKSATAITLRPYILTRLHPVQNEDDASKIEDHPDEFDGDPDDFPMHPYPSLVALGMMLIEVYKGKTIETLAAEYGIDQRDENVNAKYTIAAEVFKRCQANLLDNYRAVVNACLDLNFGSDPDGNELEGDDFRRLIYRDIVKPLEDELDQGFGMTISLDELDNITQTLDFGGWGQTMQNRRAESTVSPSPMNDETRLSNFSENACKDSSNQIKSKATTNENPNFPWWKNFETTSTFIKMQRSRLSTGQPPKRVKVAILDTGFNNRDSLFRRAKNCLPSDASIEFKDFVGDSKMPEDLSGHGTRVAYLLLKITQNVDLWIARVYEHDEGSAESAGRVTKAIEEAVKMKVDIISMSFGFEKPIHQIEHAITDAYNNGILVFAAASNDRQLANGFPISFPASMQFGVFCVNAHSSGSTPAWSGFNPRILPTRDNLCVIGEDLFGPGSAQSDNTKARVADKLFNGTSYATPIAAGIAALILEYVRNHKSLQNRGEIKEEREELRNYQAMKAIFKTMCNPEFYYGHSNPVLPWRLLKDEKDYEPWDTIKEAIKKKDN